MPKKLMLQSKKQVLVADEGEGLKNSDSDPCIIRCCGISYRGESFSANNIMHSRERYKRLLVRSSQMSVNTGSDLIFKADR